jgi:predicted amidohydrolase
MEDRGEAAKNIEQAYHTITHSEADFFVLPEFFAIPGGDFRKQYDLESCWLDTGKPAYEMLKKASTKFEGYIIGGSILEKAPDGYYNTCYVFKNGQEVARYRKINLTDEEVRLKVTPGRESVTFDTPFGKVGLLICADCMFEKTVENAALLSSIVFLPVSLTDPNHPSVEGHPISVKIASKYGIVVVKVTRVGTFGGRKIASKSAVVAPTGVVFETDRDDEDVLAEVKLLRE